MPIRPAAQPVDINPFRRQHMDLETRTIATATGRADVTVDDMESPLAWLARRRGRDGRALIEPHQLEAGERLRADFTVAHLAPRTTSDWSNPVAAGRNGGGTGYFTDVMLAARQRVAQALDKVGPEFAGLLLDVCCFLKRLEDVERERGWPARSAKVVLQLALDRLARHYGYGVEARGPARAALQTGRAEDAELVVPEV
jgi:hypothetical protein